MTDFDPALAAEQMYVEAERYERLADEADDPDTAALERQLAQQFRRGAEQVAALPATADGAQIMKAMLTSRRALSEAAYAPGLLPPRTALIGWFDALANGHRERAESSGMAHLIAAALRADAITDWMVEAPADQPDLAAIEGILQQRGSNLWEPCQQTVLIAFNKTLNGPIALSTSDCEGIIALIARAEEADQSETTP